MTIHTCLTRVGSGRRLRPALAALALVSVSALTFSSCSSPATSTSASPTGQSASTSATSTASSTTGSCAAGATQLTFWNWSTGYDLVVNEFNKTHPDICVDLENAGAAGDEYTKLADTLKAGSGAPDVATIEYFELPSFEITNSLVDLSTFGIDSVKDKIAPFAWSQVSSGSHVFAMPVDLGPIVLYYNQAEFKAAGVDVPTTWSEFAKAAQTIHAKNSSAAITNFDPETAQLVLAMMQQYGAFPFTYSGGTEIGINFTGAKQMEFAKYWQKLISAKEVTTAAEFSPTQWSNLDGGKNASRLSPAWGPAGMQLNMTKSNGNWRAAQIPQATAGGTATGNWGGSTLAVVAGSQHAKEAAEFVQWVGSSDEAWKILSGDVAGAFPAYLPLLNDSAFQSRTMKISGDSASNKVFAQAAQSLESAQWPPIMTAALTQWTSTFAGVSKGTETMQQAFTNFQDQMVKYAQAQGFTVTSS